MVLVLYLIFRYVHLIGRSTSGRCTRKEVCANASYKAIMWAIIRRGEEMLLGVLFTPQSVEHLLLQNCSCLFF